MSGIARPALRFQNPNPAGPNLIKFDGAEEIELGDGIELIVAHSRLPLWCEAGRRAMRKSLTRIAEALRQNPGYAVTVILPTLPLVADTLGFIKECGLKGRISAGFYPPD